MIRVETAVLCDYEDRLASWLQDALNNGWQMAAPPVFTHLAVPSGRNGAVVWPRPHFLVIVTKNDEPDANITLTPESSE